MIFLQHSIVLALPYYLLPYYQDDSACKGIFLDPNVEPLFVFSFPRLCNIFSWQAIRGYRMQWFCKWDCSSIILLFESQLVIVIHDTQVSYLEASHPEQLRYPLCKKNQDLGFCFPINTLDILGLIIRCRVRIKMPNWL